MSFQEPLWLDSQKVDHPRLMNKAEKKLIKQEIRDEGEIQIDYRKKYSDEFYDIYIEKFEQNQKKRLFMCFVKRSFDIFTSFIAILLLLLPFAVIAIIIKADSKGPVFFKNRRVGKNGKIFTCLKFRSMTTEAPAEVATSYGTTDGYITKFGKFLRKTSIDELPQLFNVFIGQMSIIGYRPLVPTEVRCNEMRQKMGVFSMRPGISGYAQVKGRDDVYYKNKAIMDAYYVKHANLWLDLKLIFSSVKVALGGKSNWDKSDEEKFKGKEQ